MEMKYISMKITDLNMLSYISIGILINQLRNSFVNSTKDFIESAIIKYST